MYHSFTEPIKHIDLPKRFTWPFFYSPHPLCCAAAAEVQRYIGSRSDWAEELSQGKMFGVLVVRNKAGEVGFLAAFSGNLAGKNIHEYFVPPVYDMLQPDDFFRREEAEISEINRRIRELELSPEYVAQEQALQGRLREAEAQYSEMPQMKAEKEHLQAIKAESDVAWWQHQISSLNSRMQRLKTHYDKERRAVAEELKALRSEIEPLQEERAARSAALQREIFLRFNMRNARGEERNLCDIFASTPQKEPPAGAGECAAPKLLQYAYLNGLHPLCMAEFWWGESPRGEVRHHGNFYPSCNSKCKPILLFMMQGLEVDDNPLESIVPAEPAILLEDDTLVVIDKPEGMLSVEGKSGVLSAERWAKSRYAEAMMVHRLDQSTSGILLIAKDKTTHKALQEQFIKHTIKKEYMALLEGVVAEDSGRIALPLKLDYENRPRQMVAVDGRSAVTEYEVVERSAGRTLVRFRPLTGRTHQLRVHSAHHKGLGTPIVGDDIYGRGGERLHLHASRLEFSHPVSGERVVVESAPKW